MVPTRHFGQFCLLLLCVSSLPAIAAPATIRFTIAKDFLIVVPITINGSGPYDKLLDTGSNNTMLDQKLADEFALTPSILPKRFALAHPEEKPRINLSMPAWQNALC